MNTLKDLFVRVFPLKWGDAVGKEQTARIEALFKIRNVFAHGREIWKRFTGPVGVSGMRESYSLEGSPFKPASDFLHNAGILKSLTISARSPQDFQNAFYSDDAILYWRDLVLDVEARLDAATASHLSKFQPISRIRPLTDIF